MGKRIEIKKGERYGRWEIVKEVCPVKDSRGDNQRVFQCKCECGNIKNVLMRSLRSGSSKSCGCYSEDVRFGNNYHKKINKYEIDKDLNIVTIYTFKNESFIIDLEDFDKIKDYCWCMSKGYPASTDKNSGKLIYVYNIIMDCYDKSFVVDHIDGNPCNNRKSNLRICTQNNNAKNKRLLDSNKSGVTGVIWYDKRNKWMSYITVNRKRIHLGYFINKEDAIKAREKAELKYFGEFSRNYERLVKEY